MSSVNGTTTIVYKFDIDEIQDEFGPNLTAPRVQEIANILAHNVEEPLVRDDKDNIRIVPENFNNSFHDMMDDLKNS